MSLQPVLGTVVLGIVELSYHAVTAQKGREDDESKNLQIGLLAMGLSLLFIGVLAVAGALIYLLVKRRKKTKRGPSGIRELAEHRSKRSVHNIYSIDPHQLKRHECDVDSDQNMVQVAAINFSAESVPTLPMNYCQDEANVNNFPNIQGGRNSPSIQQANWDSTVNMDVYESIFDPKDQEPAEDYHSDSSYESDFEVPPQVRRANPSYEGSTNSVDEQEDSNTKSEVPYVNKAEVVLGFIKVDQSQYDDMSDQTQCNQSLSDNKHDQAQYSNECDQSQNDIEGDHALCDENAKKDHQQVVGECMDSPLKQDIPTYDLPEQDIRGAATLTQAGHAEVDCEQEQEMEDAATCRQSMEEDHFSANDSQNQSDQDNGSQSVNQDMVFVCGNVLNEQEIGYATKEVGVTVIALQD